MLVHTGGRDDGARLLRRRPRGGPARAALRAGPDPGLLHARVGAGVPRRRRLVRRPGDAGRAGAGAGPLRHRAAGRARGAGGEPRARGRRRQPRAGLLHLDPGADPHPLRGGAGDLRARRQAARRGRPVSLPRARRRPRATRRGGFGAVLPRRDRAPDLRLGARARRHPRRRRPRRLRADRPRAGLGELSRPRGAHQPAAVVGGDPDRLRARAAGRRIRLDRDRADRRGDGAAQAARTREFLGGPLRGGFRGPLPRPGPARLDHPHHRDRRRRQSAPASPARTGPAPASSSPGPASTSTTCSARRTSTRSAFTATSPVGGCRR